MERNIRKFDISQPIQAFHFASIVLRLKARDRELRDIFARQAKTTSKSYTKANIRNGLWRTGGNTAALQPQEL